jgi:hypothetical protein
MGVFLSDPWSWRFNIDFLRGNNYHIFCAPPLKGSTKTSLIKRLVLNHALLGILGFVVAANEPLWKGSWAPHRVVVGMTVPFVSRCPAVERHCRGAYSAHTQLLGTGNKRLYWIRRT